MEHKFIVSSSPHVKSNESVSSVMLDVIIALIPACLAGIYFFGVRALVVILTAIASCVLSEYIFQKVMKRKVTTGDLSAVVTGMLLAMNLPSTIPLWMVAIGSAFAIIIVKQLYGGLGKNFMNPALAARCFMLAAWAGSMSTFIPPFSGFDAVSTATPLAVLKGIQGGNLPTLLGALWGEKGGCIGETSGIALLIGFLYLVLKGVVDIKIPLCYLGSFAVLMYLFGNNLTGESQAYFTAMHILSGGLLIGVFFMATDYVTSPTSPIGRIIFGLGCGFLTFALRKFGSYPDGVSYAIILMNVMSPLIERFTIVKPFGEVKKNG